MHIDKVYVGKPVRWIMPNINGWISGKAEFDYGHVVLFAWREKDDHVAEKWITYDQIEACEP